VLQFEIPDRLPKAPGMYDRSVPLEQTMRLVPSLRKQYGITRIADLTYLDRSGIPVVNAVVPDSPDAISVYNGKGPTRENALVGAVMEAVERQTGANPNVEPVNMTPAEARNAIDGREYGMREEWWERPIPFVRGYDLIQERPMYVPLPLVQCPWPGPPVFDATSSNGLASGNNLVEAIYHALCELVERHVWSIAHARGHVLPRLLLEELSGAPGSAFAPFMTDDPVGTTISVPTGFSRVDALVDRLRAASIGLALRAIEERRLPITIIACVFDLAENTRIVYAGLGCSWSPEHAAVRAITEAVQSRLVDIQGAREDALRASDPPSLFGDHGRRPTQIPRGRWYFDAPAPAAALAALPDRASSDLVQDLCALIDALRDAGINRAVVVDLTRTNSPVSVVRAIVPDLESALVDRRIGPTIRGILAPYSTRYRS
jgi:ribosomal protein S12 methylthiotransferase accessory factor